MERRRTFAGRIPLLLTIALGAIFAFSGVMKILSGYGFAGQVRAYRLIPEALLPAVGYVVPLLELFGASCLIFRRSRPAGAAILASLAFLFATAVASATIRGLEISCGCFGGEGGKVGIVTLLLDIALLAIARIAYRTSSDTYELDRSASR